MEINLGPDLEAKLGRLAFERGSDAELLAKEAIERFVVDDELYVRQVEVGLEQIERGETLSHEEVGARLESLIRRRQSGG